MPSLTSKYPELVHYGVVNKLEPTALMPGVFISINSPGQDTLLLLAPIIPSKDFGFPAGTQAWWALQQNGGLRAINNMEYTPIVLPGQADWTFKFDPFDPLSLPAEWITQAHHDIAFMRRKAQLAHWAWINELRLDRLNQSTEFLFEKVVRVLAPLIGNKVGHPQLIRSSDQEVSAKIIVPNSGDTVDVSKPAIKISVSTRARNGNPDDDKHNCCLEFYSCDLPDNFSDDSCNLESGTPEEAARNVAVWAGSWLADTLVKSLEKI